MFIKTLELLIVLNMFLVTQLLKKQWVMVPNQYSEYPIVEICVSNYPIRKKSYLQLCLIPVKL